MSIVANITREEPKDIKALIEEAKALDAKFKKQIEHRINKRQKTPEFDWLMGNLVRILGEDYVREQAKKYIEKNKEAKTEES